MRISHNAMTYLTPKKWWMRLIAFTARCQGRDYKKQDSDGYDVRVWLNENGCIEFRHGIIAYPANEFGEFLHYCNKEYKVVRLMLECRNRRMLNDVEERHLDDWFRCLCRELESDYPNIRFFGGRNVYTWEQLYDFGWEPQTYDYYSSQDGNKWYNKINDLWPWLWAKMNNRKVFRFEKAHEVCLYDYL